MNILLCMPDGPYQLTGWSAPPIGIAYVSASLKAAGHNVFCINFMLEERTVREALEQDIPKYNIEIVGIGDLVVNYTFMQEIIDTAKDVSPDIITFIGGGFVTYSPTEAMTLISSADYGVVGEGEITCCELFRALESKSPLADIPGILHREDGRVVYTGDRTEYPDLESIPFPDYEGFELEKIISNGSASVVTSRSCPFSCTFCTHSGGKRYRQRSIDSVFAEIEFLVNRYRVKRLLLNDELFSTAPKRVLEFCDRIKNYNLQWYVFLRVSDQLTTELLIKMKDSGCVLIFYGLESADDCILESMNKKITLKQIEQTLTRTKIAGIEARGNFIFGDIAETMETAQNTLNWVRTHSDLLQYIKLSPIILYPGSPLYETAVKTGMIPDTIEFIKAGCPPLNVSMLSDDEYDSLINVVLPSEQARLLDEQKILTFENGNTDYSNGLNFSWICPGCSSDNKRRIDVSDIYIAKKTEDRCFECKTTASYNAVYEYADLVEPILNKLMQEHRCVFWGSGWFLMHIFDRLKSLSESNLEFWICDRSPSKQSGGFRGLPVYPPSILNDAEIEICIITSVYIDEIKREIEQKYPGVKAIGFHELPPGGVLL